MIYLMLFLLGTLTGFITFDYLFHRSLRKNSIDNYKLMKYLRKDGATTDEL